MCIARETLGIAAKALAIVMATAAQADEIKVTVHEVTSKSTGKEVGAVQFRDDEYGLLVIPDLQGLTTGPHGAHIHDKPDCGPSRHDGETMPGPTATGTMVPMPTARAACACTARSSTETF